MIINKDLKRRIIEISYKKKLSHLGSCLTAVDIIDEIFKKKKKNEPFILSSGHAGLALYVVLEKYYGKNAEDIFDHHGVHPDRCSRCSIDCSTGSLGQGLPMALGMALANRKRNVYCLISDGECAEGSIWEATRIKREQKLNNLKIYLNYNGFSAYRSLNFTYSLVGIGIDQIRYTGENWDRELEGMLPFLQGQQAHYYVMNENDYKVAMKILK